MGSTASLALLLLLAAAVPAVFAVTYQVGDASGWSSGVNYTDWANGKTFRVGDILEFQYGPSHSVSVVDKTGFDGCDVSSATQRFSDGDTKIDLTTVGTMHFLCPTVGHCLGGMKLAVTVLAAPSTPANPPPPSSPRRSSPPPSSSVSPPLAPRSPRKPKTQPPSASPPVNGTPEKESTAPSQSPMTSSPSPSPSPSPNAAFKGVMMSYGMMGLTMVLMYGIMN